MPPLLDYAAINARSPPIILFLRMEPCAGVRSAKLPGELLIGESSINIKTEAMKHNNCVRRHRLHGSPDTKVISILYFPELHVLTGVIAKLLTAMMESYPQHEAEAAKEWLSKWMKKHNIQWRVDRPAP